MNLFLDATAKKPPALLEWLFVAFLLTIIVGFSPLQQAEIGDGETETSIVKIISYIVFSAIGIVVGFRSLGHTGSFLKWTLVWLLSMSVWGLVTLSWSMVPLFGLRLCGFMLALSLGFIGFLVALGRSRGALVFARTLLGIVLASLVAGVFFAGAKHSGGDWDGALNGEWKGILPHKNSAGVVSAIVIIFYLHEWLRSRRLLNLLWMVCGAALLILSQSKTSTLLIPIAVSIGWLFGGLPKSSAFSRAMAFWLGMILMSFIAAITVFVIDTGIDITSSFTGRGEIWRVVSMMIEDRPFLGHGFGSVFRTDGVSALSQYTHNFVLMMPQAHNGYLEVLVSTGVIGLVICLWGLLGLGLRGVSYVDTGNVWSKRCLWSFYLFAILHNVLETSLFTRVQTSSLIIFFVLVITADYLAQAARTKRTTQINDMTSGYKVSHDD